MQRWRDKKERRRAERRRKEKRKLDRKSRRMIKSDKKIDLSLLKTFKIFPSAQHFLNIF